jgi:hypothetical protein
MKIILAQLNTNPDSEGQDRIQRNLNFFIISFGYKKGPFLKGFVPSSGYYKNVFFAYSAETLIDVLQDFNGEPFWLFTNFPNDNSYLEKYRNRTRYDSCKG